MTVASGCASSWLDIGGPEVDVVGAAGCGGCGFDAAGRIRGSESGGGGDGVGEWSGVIGLVEMWSGDGLWI